jgi:AraC family transcriptional regulator, positive regulator of tynA and feaB
MGISEAATHRGALRNREIGVWDTQYARPREAFTVYRDAVCKVFMPWSPEYKSDEEFHARIEALAVGRGSIGRLQMSPLVAIRSKQDIANSALDCFYANFVVSGELKVEQSGRSNYLRSGDLVVYDGSLPATLTSSDRGPYDVLAFLMPKDSFSAIRDAEDRFHNVLFTNEQMIAPLSSCLRFLAQNMLSSPASELSAISDAFVSLLPVAAGRPDGNQREILIGARGTHFLRAILDFVNHNVSNPDLSPQEVADHIGISVRYLHKLFLVAGMTFGAYVLERRLNYVCRDLLSLASRPQPIGAVAFRWGFKDLSTFSKAFRRKFGCPPSLFRSAA